MRDPGLERALQELAVRTRGWDVGRRARAYAEVRQRWVLQSPGNLAVTVDPLVVQTPALQLIDEALLRVDAGQARRLIVTMPPQEGKSSRIARAGALWLLGRDPERRVAVGSYADSLAMGHGRWVRDTVWTFGADAVTRRGGQQIFDLRIDPRAAAKGEWELDEHRGGVKSVGVGAGLTGFPVDFMIIDDPIKDREAADSEVVREKVWAWWTEVVIPRLAPGGSVVIVMTRWHEDDLVGRLLAEDEALPEAERVWQTLRIPAQCEDPATDPLGRALGEYMISARGRRDWEAIKRSVGARAWAALYQGRPAPLVGGIFRWEWIRPFRCGPGDVPHLQRVAVAVDTTGGGSDEAGIVAGGRGDDGRTYVLADASRAATAGGQWRTAWLTVLQWEADVLVYESNLVDPIMRKGIRAAWRRMREQAQALHAAGALDPSATAAQLQARIRAAAAGLRVGGDDDVAADDDPAAVLTRQLLEVLPYARRILDAPERGPARVEGVRATRGKTTRAEPCAQAYEAGEVSHVGTFPALEDQLVTWQEGQPSPNRLDAGVWLWHHLNSRGQGSVASPARRRPPGAPAGRAGVVLPRRRPVG